MSFIHIKKAWFLSKNDITGEREFIKRREILKKLASGSLVFAG